MGVGRGADPNAHFAALQALEHRYAPLLLETQPTAQVLLYQTWTSAQTDNGEAGLLSESLKACQATLVAAGIADVRVARAGHAFLAVRSDPGADRHIYPALFKDDSGHGSALAGVLVAAVIVQALNLGTNGSSVPRRPLGPILESMIPSAWRTASSGYAGEADFGQKSWNEGNRAALGGLLDDPDADLGPLSRYPPGMRTEKRSLGLSPGDTLAAAAAAAAGEFTLPSGMRIVDDTACASITTKESAPTGSRRWRAQ